LCRYSVLALAQNGDFVGLQGFFTLNLHHIDLETRPKLIYYKVNMFSYIFSGFMGKKLRFRSQKFYGIHTARKMSVIDVKCVPSPGLYFLNSGGFSVR
jgi:hypothetical protein